MKFGKVDNPEIVDFTLPPDHPDSSDILKKYKGSEASEIYIGCAKWNRQDLKNFYPRGTKDELAYYSSQFNTIELNATFYRIFPVEQVEKWREKTPDNFRFYPKVPQMISHLKRLNEAQGLVEEHCHCIRAFGEKLGGTFLQLPDNFKPRHFDRVVKFVEEFPKDIPLSVELRNTEWFSDPVIAEDVYSLFERHGVSNIITDTAGRRDLLHMRLTGRDIVVRYVGANHSSDYDRLDTWFERIKLWIDSGMQTLYFFVHQNLEQESPHLSNYITRRLNDELGFKLTIPQTQPYQQTLGI